MESRESNGSSDESENEDNDEEEATTAELRKKCLDKQNPIGEKCGCECGEVVLSPKPHRCNDPSHIGNRSVFGAICFADNNTGGESWNMQCLACFRRATKVVDLSASL